MFYLNDVLSVKKGEEIRGELTCRPNLKNPRDLDIGIAYKFTGSYDTVSSVQNYTLR